MLFKEAAAADRHLGHGIGHVPVASQEDRGGGPGKFRRGVGRIDVRRRGLDGQRLHRRVAHDERAGVEVGAGTGGDPVVERLKRTFDQRVVAVEEDDVFALGVVEGRVAGGGGRAAARLDEHLDARIAGGDLAHGALRPVRRSLDDGKKLPVRERLFPDGAETFAHVRFHVAAGNDYGIKRSHVCRRFILPDSPARGNLNSAVGKIVHWNEQGAAGVKKVVKYPQTF